MVCAENTEECCENNDLVSLGTHQLYECKV